MDPATNPQPAEPADFREDASYDRLDIALALGNTVDRPDAEGRAEEPAGRRNRASQG